MTSQALFTYAPGADRAALDARLGEIARQQGAIDAFTQADQPSNAALSEDINGFGEMAVMFPILFLGAAAMATYILLTRLVLSQQAQVGLLLANGFGRGTVFRHFLSFGLAAALAGAVPGLVAGIVLARFVTRLYTDAVSVPIHVIQFHPTTVIVGLVFAVVVGRPLDSRAGDEGGSARARRGDARADRLRPRRSQPPRAHRAPAWLRCRRAGRWSLRGVGRNRRRSLSTVLGIVLAATLILASWGMLDTTTTLLQRQFVDIQRQDAEAYFAGADGAGATAASATRDVAAVAAVPGVARAEALADVPAAIRSSSGMYRTELAGLRAGDAHARLLRRRPSDACRRRRRVSTWAARCATCSICPWGTKSPSSSRRSGRPSTSASPGSSTSRWVPSPTSRCRNFGAPSAPGHRTRSTRRWSSSRPGRTARPCAPASPRLPEVAAVVDARALYTAAQSFMGLFYAFVGLMVVLGAVMALALIYTTMSANISERLTELASLRAAGMGRRQLTLLVSSENLLLTVIGIVPGLVIGYYAAAAFMASFSSDLFSFDLALRPWTPALVALALIAAALLSQWPVLRAVDRIDVAVVVRERST